MTEKSTVDFFDKIYDEYYKKIYNYAYARLLEHYAAEDVTEEIFFAVFEHITNFDVSRGSVSTWMFTIAHNKILDYNKKAYLNHEVNVDTPPTIEFAEENNEVGTLKNPINWRVKKILEKLSASEREFLALRYELEMSNIEIANIVNSTPNAVSSRYRRLLEKCRNIANEF